MYPGPITTVRSASGNTRNFTVNAVVQQGSALSPFIFLLVLDEMTGRIQGETLWSMTFSDDVALIDQNKES